MNIAFLDPAQAELDDAINYYNRERTGLGDEFLVEALRALERTADFPHAWHPFSRRTRRCLIRRFPYGVIYQVIGNDILVIAITHLHRKPGYWKHRLSK
jgi:plasmid stabilization system protein ParE